MGKRKLVSVLKPLPNHQESSKKGKIIPALHFESHGSTSKVTHTFFKPLGEVHNEEENETNELYSYELNAIETISDVAVEDEEQNVTKLLEIWLVQEAEDKFDRLDVDSSEQPEMQRTRTHAHPIDDWRVRRQVYVEELCRLDGRGEFRNQIKCSGPNCNVPNPDYRCQTCSLSSMLCKHCIVQAHRSIPLHRIQKWSVEKQMFIPGSLRELGLCIQLGHSLDQACLNPISAKTRSETGFVIVDVDGIHNVQLNYCGCFGHPEYDIQLLRHRLWPATIQSPATAMTFRALEHLQLLSYESKLSVHDWYDACARMMDNTGLANIPDRKEEVRRMLREWGHSHLLKRAGRVHDPTGVDATALGECAVLCPACPHPGKNLPEDWRDVPDNQRWLYAEYVGLNANFRSTRKNVSSHEKDPALSLGYAYCIPAKPFLEYLTKWQGAVQPRSKCVSHDAVNSADTKDTKGFVVSGIGAVDDIRHGFKRPNATGDLQKGERYVNMDYFLYSSLLGRDPDWLFISYDIACQYSINFKTRFQQRFPEGSALNNGRTQIRWLVPKFHLPVHIPQCQVKYSFNYLRWVGRTEGEALERNWPELNRLAASTKEMGPGARSDTMDEHMGDANWRKLVNLGDDLLMRLKSAIAEAAKHASDHHEMERGLRESHRDSLDVWKREIEAWEANPALESPFSPRISVPTEASIKLQLAEAELELNQSANPSICEVLPTAFISMGLELEYLQAKLCRNITNLGIHATSKQRADITSQSNSLYTRIKAWMNVQALYMPATVVLRSKSKEEVSKSAQLHTATLKLWLPSEMNDHTMCEKLLVSLEWNGRIEQAMDTLEKIRLSIRLCGFLEKKKKDWSHGVREGNRSHTGIQDAKAQIRWLAGRYRTARSALESLFPRVSCEAVLYDEWKQRFQPLTEADLVSLPADALEFGEGHKRLSWIWLAVGMGNGQVGELATEKGLTEALRLNWCRSHARMLRWHEEVELLREEMRRVTAFMTWHSTWWLQKASQCRGAPELEEGLRAYATKQAELRLALRDKFTYLWRHISSWCHDPTAIPATRRWYATIIRPRDAPKSVFAWM